MKILAKIFLFLVLLALPAAARWAWLNLARYRPPEIPEVKAEQIVLPEMVYNAYADRPIRAQGRIVFDLGHENNLRVDDLTPLQDRLSARGLTIQVYDGYSQTLEDVLRGATGFVVIAPAYAFSEEEITAVETFVEDGGRLLLAADPTRPVPIEAESLYDVFFPPSAVPAINSLSGRFGIVFFEDYLYNLADNVGNYRNVRFSGFKKGNVLTEGLDSVVLFATHSLQGQGVPVLQAGSGTQSNLRVGESGLIAGLLAMEGQVLALGDMTFLTVPYHTVADNDHFMSNVADWLASARREWDLSDFPYLFNRPVDLVPTADEPLDPNLLTLQDTLRPVFDAAGITVTLRSQPDLAHDVLYFGTFENAQAVKRHLDAAEITFELSSLEAEGNDSQAEESPQDIVEVPSLGAFLAQDTALFVVNQGEEGVVLVILAWDESAVSSAVERLAYQGLSDCAGAGEVFVCAAKGATAGAEEETPPEEDFEGEKQARILIISNDDGVQGTQTSVDEMEELLSVFYDVAVWSTRLNGLPTDEDLVGYDAYILDSGDYAWEEETDYALLDAIFWIDHGNVAILGDQSFPIDALLQSPAPLYDLQVVDSSHPLAGGFLEETIGLLDSQSGVPSLVLTVDDVTLDETTVAVFERGPASPHSGTPILIAGEQDGERFVLAGFAVYRLPEDVRTTFIFNLVAWLLFEI